jgi:hypothetical protein
MDKRKWDIILLFDGRQIGQLRKSSNYKESESHPVLVCPYKIAQTTRII